MRVEAIAIIMDEDDVARPDAAFLEECAHPLLLLDTGRGDEQRVGVAQWLVIAGALERVALGIGALEVAQRITTALGDVKEHAVIERASDFRVEEPVFYRREPRLDLSRFGNLAKQQECVFSRIHVPYCSRHHKTRKAGALGNRPFATREGEEKDGMSLTLSILQSAHGNGVSRTLRLDDKGNDMVRRGFETVTRAHVRAG